MVNRGGCYVKKMVAVSGVVEFQKRSRSVPTWEKRFSWEVGSLPRKRLENSKKYIYDTHRVVLWNDSAAEEAFNKANLGYWLKINGLPCRIPLPSPDIYIDKIDWNPKSDNSVTDSEILQCVDEASTMEEEEGEEEKLRKTFEVPSDQKKPTFGNAITLKCFIGEVDCQREWSSENRINSLVVGMETMMN